MSTGTEYVHSPLAAAPEGLQRVVNGLTARREGCASGGGGGSPVESSTPSTRWTFGQVVSLTLKGSMGQEPGMPAALWLHHCCTVLSFDRSAIVHTGASFREQWHNFLLRPLPQHPYLDAT